MKVGPHEECKKYSIVTDMQVNANCKTQNQQQKKDHFVATKKPLVKLAKNWKTVPTLNPPNRVTYQI